MYFFVHFSLKYYLFFIFYLHNQLIKHYLHCRKHGAFFVLQCHVFSGSNTAIPHGL